MIRRTPALLPRLIDLAAVRRTSALPPRLIDLAAVRRMLALMPLLGLLAGTPVRAEDISVSVPAGTGFYRELRLAANLGLTDGPYTGRRPLSRAAAFQLMRAIPVEVDDGRRAHVRPDPALGITGPTAVRLTSTRDFICPWPEFWPRGEYPITFGGNLLRAVRVNYSEVVRGERAPDYLDYGYDHRRGWTGDWDSRMFVEMEWLALDYLGRLRADGDAVTFRPITLTARTGWNGIRLVVGREPLDWGPGVHGNLLLTTNGRAMDQVRLESDAPFRLFSPLDRIGRWDMGIFASKLDDPDRSDSASPWVTGLRITYAPWRWLQLGLARTAMLNGEGNPFDFSMGALFDLFLGRDEHDVGNGNDTDQYGSVDAQLFLWPMFRHLPVLDGGRLYLEYGGTDSPQSGPLPSATAHTYGIELVAAGVTLRAEASNTRDDANLWYWHRVYTEGYTYRGRVLGHPMGGDARAQSYAVDVPVGSWGLVSGSMERQEHGFFAQPGVPPGAVTGPILNATQDTFTLAIEKYVGDFPGAFRLEGRMLREFGEVDVLGPLEDWGVTVAWIR